MDGAEMLKLQTKEQKGNERMSPKKMQTQKGEDM
ncbi:hypothetical protein COLO4_35505 [Corchorus olitorius]|uniref:Uncharacterized protein n=1 Tax=Corchorus olitorius TaxID=93759 RepID=A0A1R3GG74_9ROSI|nr:hypothetical protein COLO4_35505 [Corchorus olitorius]